MTRIFPNTGLDFSGYNAAVAWLESIGFSVGSTQVGAPTAVFKGDCLVSKWRNLSTEEREAVDGRIESLDRRRGEVTVWLREEMECTTPSVLSL